ncbi:hypothetical protein MNBD_CHLOROFLEXI01-3654 [hydrothermal vent metagenome]|uniref:Mycothiol-dependent maleylpyruvate isomerase metal-binding domain-containing protein n=1 Tax=hydrothermal vent metagenome TaxID=652676 RepID=A0A3B0V251_9ZZZZ
MNDHKMETNINKLKIDLKFAHANFVQVANQLDPNKRCQAGVCGEWSPKDVVSHLVGWDKSLKAFIEDVENFDPPYDADDFNRLSVKSRKHLSWNAVMNELKTNFLDLEQAITTVTPRMKIYNRVMGWLSGRIEDYDLHKSQLEDWL